MIKISIIIVNHNGKRFLPRLLDSIHKQTVSAFEIILVDNDSQDRSVEFVTKKYPAIRILCEKNRGYGQSANTGARHAKGTYLMFFNEDMYLPLDYLEKMTAYRKSLEKNYHRIGAIGSKIIPFDSNPSETDDCYGGRLDLFGYPSNNCTKREEVFLINGCPFFIERELFMSSKGFHPAIFLYGDDSDLCWRLKLLGYSCFMTNGTHAYHFGGGITGGLLPQKVAYLLYGPLVGILTNYSPFTLLLMLPVYFVYHTFLHMALFVYFKFNVAYNKTLLMQMLQLLRDRKQISTMRLFVQKREFCLILKL